MLDFLIILGQAAAALLLLYGGFLVLQTVIFPQRKPQTPEQERKYEMLRLKYIL